MSSSIPRSLFHRIPRCLFSTIKPPTPGPIPRNTQKGVNYDFKVPLLPISVFAIICHPEPITWQGFAITSVIIASGLAYIQSEREKLKAKSRTNETEHLKKNKNIGRPDIGGPFKLEDTNGNVVDEKTYDGKFKLIYFGFTHCPDICPQELDKMGDAIDILQKEGGLSTEVVPIFITIDPERDTSSVISSYLSEFHPSMVGLRGSVSAVGEAAKAYRVYFSAPVRNSPTDTDYLVDHSIFFFLMAPDGVFSDYFGRDVSASEVAKRIRVACGEWESETREGALKSMKGK